MNESKLWTGGPVPEIRYWIVLAEGEAGGQYVDGLFNESGGVNGGPCINVVINQPIEGTLTLLRDGILQYARWLQIQKNTQSLKRPKYFYQEVDATKVPRKIKAAIELTAQKVKEDLQIGRLPEIRFIVESLDGSGIAYDQEIAGCYYAQKKLCFVRVDLPLKKVCETVAHELMHHSSFLKHEKTFCNLQSAINSHMNHDNGSENACRQFEKKYSGIAKSDILKVFDPKPRPSCFGRHDPMLRCESCF